MTPLLQQRHIIPPKRKTFAAPTIYLAKTVILRVTNDLLIIELNTQRSKQHGISPKPKPLRPPMIHRGIKYTNVPKKTHSCTLAKSIKFC
jgi:hypothetical protein